MYLFQFSLSFSVCHISRENDLRERIALTWPSSHENYFQSILGSESYCVVILRTPPNWLVRVALCNFDFTADHAQQAIWPANLVLLLSTSQEIYAWNNLARIADEEQNGPGLWEFAGEGGSNSAKTAYWGLRYISMARVALGKSFHLCQLKNHKNSKPQPEKKTFSPTEEGRI